MKYHIGRNGQQVGEYSLQELQAGWARGDFLPEDLVWREGMSDWIPLSQLTELAAESTPTPSPAAVDAFPANQAGQFEPPPESFSQQDAHSDPQESDDWGPAWENPDQGSIFQRAWLTVQGVFSAPGEFFRTMRPTGGLGQPLLFYPCCFTLRLAGLPWL